MASEEIDKVLAEWSSADSKVIKLYNEWTIVKYHDMPVDQDHLLDQISSNDRSIGDLWNAKIKPSIGDCRYSKYNFTFTLKQVCVKIPILIRIRFMFKSWIVITDDKSQDYLCGTETDSLEIFKNTVYFNPRRDHILNKDFSIICEIIMVTNPVNVISYIKENQKMKLENYLSQDLELLFNNQKCGDFTFKFDDKELRASRDILSARSPVFATMFDEESGFKENKEKCADIIDIEYNVFREMLFYIYTDKVPKLNEMAQDLLAAAEKYQLKHLKAMSEEALSQTISIENAFDILTLADKYNCPQLKFNLIGFFAMHKEKLMESNAYKSLLITNPVQMKELFLEVSNRKELPADPNVIIKRRKVSIRGRNRNSTVKRRIMASDEANGTLAEFSKTDTEVIIFRNEWVIKEHFHVKLNVIHDLGKISSGRRDIGDEWCVTFEGLSRYNLRFSVTQSKIPKIPIMIKFRVMIMRGKIEKTNRWKDVFSETTKNNKPIFQEDISVCVYDYVNENLTIACEMTMIPNPVTVNSYIKKNDERKFHTLENYLTREMELLLIQQKTGDFIFKFDDKQLRASREILSARSPVFAVMFDEESGFKESRDKCADIVDIEYEVFREMLLYIYTDKVPKMDEMTEELLAAAEKYQLKNLKAMCQSALWQKISIENVLDIVEISDKYNCPQLRFQAIEYIGKNKKNLLESDSYKFLLGTNPVQAKDLIFEVVNQEEFSPQPENINRKTVELR